MAKKFLSELNHETNVYTLKLEGLKLQQQRHRLRGVTPDKICFKPLLLIRVYGLLVLTCWCAFHCNNIQTIDVPANIPTVTKFFISIV